MKAKARIALAATMVLTMVTPVLAETGARQDDSNVLVWAFLGACALIIFLQLVPVITMAFGLIKGATSAEEDAELEPASSKYR